MQGIDQICQQIKLRVCGLKAGGFCDAGAGVFRFLDGRAGALEGGATELIDGGPQGAGDGADADADAELQGVEVATKVKQEVGNLKGIGGHGLEFITCGDCVGQADTVIVQMSRGGRAKADGKQGTDAAGAAGADDIGHDDGPEAFAKCMHKYVQL